MSSSHLLPQSVLSSYHPLSSRASSATLFLSQRIPYSHIDGPTGPVDMSIAQGLLRIGSPRIPRRRSSFSYSTSAQQSHHCLENDDHLSGDELCHDQRLRHGISSKTWTSSSGDRSEDGGNNDHTPFVEEFNRLAKKCGIRTIVPDESIVVHVEEVDISAKPGNWIIRKLLGRSSSAHGSKRKTRKHVRHKRSVSEISLRVRPKKDTLKGKDLVELVRLCGASPLYLPAEYAASTLAVPTCFRATAQYLVQHAATSRGVFRIPGAHSTINALYNHYASQDEDGEIINGTVRCPTLPEHIQCNVHDVASAFKKFLAGLPGGILGKAWLFDAFVSIYSQLDAAAELMKTKQSKVRARLIALAIATVAPRYQRELICAVLGLLSMIGRAAEIAPREDEHGRPLPTSDLMGYGALGIVFGPLLVGDLLDTHDLCSKGLHGSWLFVKRSPPRSSRGRHKKNKSADDSAALLQGTDKIRIVNSITEMLITHWRDVVWNLKNLGALSSMKQHHSLPVENLRGLPRSLAPRLYNIRKPLDWDAQKTSIYVTDRSKSPTPSSRNNQINHPSGSSGQTSTLQDDVLSVRKQRHRSRPMSSQVLSGSRSMSILAPTIEEYPIQDRHEPPMVDTDHETSQNALHLHWKGGLKACQSMQTFYTARSEQASKISQDSTAVATSHLVKQEQGGTDAKRQHFTVAYEDGQDNWGIAQQVHKEHGPSGNSTKMDAFGMDKSGTRHIGASLLLNMQKHSEHLSNERRASSSPLGNSSCVHGLPKTLSQVPAGIVPSRLRGIAASDPGRHTPSGYHGLLKADYKGMLPQKRKLYTTTGSSQAFKHYPKDPLSRVSREEDIASLASLAEVIQSQDEAVYPKSPSTVDLSQRPGTLVNLIKRRMRSTLSVTSIPELRRIKSLSEMASQKNVEKHLISTSTTLPVDIDGFPMTPHRSVTDLSIPEQSGRSSVKALTSRFGNAKTNVRQTPSHIHTPDPRVWHGLVEKAVVPYIHNTSPVSREQKLIKPVTSLQAARHPIQVKIRTAASSSMLQINASPLPLKALFSNSYSEGGSAPPKWPKLRRVDRSPRLDIDLVLAEHEKLTLPTFSSNLHRTGDGNGSFTLPSKSSQGALLPRPDEPSAARDMEFPQPRATYADYYSSLVDFSNSSPLVLSGTSNSSFVGQKNQGTSILYTQIQHLYRQLKVKTNEADHLRQQLMTKDSLNDLSTLSQRLTQANRELGVWRGRAEIAEKRLEMLTRLSQKESNEAVAHVQIATKNLASTGRSISEEEERPKILTRNELHRLDGVSSGHDMPGSEGTIRRVSPEQRYVSETELDNTKEGLSLDSYLGGRSEQG